MGVKGHHYRNKKRIVCDIDPDEFQEIDAMEIPGCNSMASKIRTLITWGIDSMEMQDAAK